MLASGTDEQEGIVACGCGKSREERMADRIARSERIRLAREEQAAARAARRAQAQNTTGEPQPAKAA